MTDTTRAARYSDVAAALEALPPDQTGRTLDLLARMLDLTDADMHRRTGGQISRATVNAKRKGRSPVRPEDLWPLADALTVDIDVLLMPPAEAAAWLAEYRPEELNQPVAPGKTGRANTGTDQAGHRAITHRRGGFPCRRPLVGASKHSVRFHRTPRIPTSLTR